MNDILKTYMERFRENRHTLRRYTAFVLALAMITTLFVNWQLHGVGISMTAQYQCGEEEHTHTADCYTKVLTCGYEEGELENADEVAAAAATSQPTVEAEPMPLSLEPQIEFVPHEHTEDCYTEVQTLTCMEEEHVHDDDCFDPEDGSLICDKFEHTHDESCYTTEYELTCGLEEGELVEQVVEPTQSAELAAMAVAEPVALAPMVDTVEPIYHHHTDACYEEVLTCPLPEHHHTVACLSDTSADLETPEEWQAANAEAVMTGNWAEDLVSVAKTQLGYEQSEKNFEIDPADGVTLRYYSRYGQSYGNPYGEWDVMFLSYCLKYAGIPQSAIPQEASVLALRSSMSDMDWLLDNEDGSAADVGDIVIYNKYVTRTVAVDSSADGAADGLDDLFSTDAEGENGAELEESGTAALDTAPAAEDMTTLDTPDLPDTAAPSVGSPAAEPQTTTVTDAQPVETVGIVSSVDSDAGTLTVISGDVDGKVAEVTLSSAEVLAVVDVAAAQYADEMLSSAVDGALKAPDMLTLAGEPMTASTTAVGSALNGAQYVTDFKIQKQQGSQYVDAATSVVTDKMHGYLELKDIPAKDIADNNYQVKVALPEAFDLKDFASDKGDLIDPNYTGPKGSVCGTYQFVEENGKWYVLFTYDHDFIHQDQLSNTTKVRSTVNFDFRWDQTKVTTGGSNEFKVNEKAKVTIYIKREEGTTPGEEKKFSLDKQSAELKYDDKKAYVDYTVKLTLKEDRAAPLTLTDTLQSPSGVTFDYVDTSLQVTGPDSSAPTISWANTADGKTITLGTSGTLQKGIYTITYRVKADNFGNQGYNGDDLKNLIEFGGDVEGTSTSIKTKDIEKSGKLNKDGETITWTVKINNGDVMRYLPANAKFTDTIDTNQEFVANSFKVKKTDADGNETKTKPTDVYNSTDHKLTYNLELGFNKYEITYQTRVTKAIPLTGLDVKNTGNLEGGGLDSSSEGTVHIDSDVLTKEAVGEPTNDGTTATLQWKSTINAENVDSYIYYDYSGTFWDNNAKKNYKAQEIDLSSIKVTDKDGHDVTKGVKITEWTDSGKKDDYGKDLGLFTINFKGSGVTGPLTITYATKVKIDSLPGSSAAVENICYINDGSTVSAEQKVNKTSDMIQYFYKYAGEFNWNNVQNGSGSTTLQPGQKLPWTIVLNADGVLKWKNDKQWVITDTIPRGLVLDESSVQIKNYGVALPATSTVTKNADGTTTLVITMLPESFSYTNNSVTEIRKQINITYDTTLDPKCTDIWNDNTASFRNVAEFKRNGEKIGDTSFTETVTRRVVGKSGTFDETTGLLTYQVKLNPYGATLNNGTDMVLQDVMTVPSDLWADGSGNKRVTLEGISVFDAKLQADGTLEATTWRADLTCVAGNNVDTSTYYFKYSSDNSHQLKAWTKVPDSTPLVLVFHYRVNTEGLVKGNAFTFENTATLNGKWKNEQCNTSFTSSSGATAGIDFNSNRLTIVKYSGTPDKVLPGAEFSLEKYNETSWDNVGNCTTSTSGNVTLGSLDVNTFYRLKETQAPDGYRTPNNYHYFVISDNSHSYTASGVPDFKSTDTFSEYKLAEGQNFGSFYYYCENTPNDNSDYVLPSTGGTGTFPYTAVGGTMMLSALAYSFIHRKRRREGRADD